MCGGRQIDIAFGGSLESDRAEQRSRADMNLSPTFQTFSFVRQSITSGRMMVASSFVTFHASE